MIMFKIIVTGTKLSDGKQYKLEYRTQAETTRQAEASVGEYDWDDAATMVVSIFPEE